MNYSEIVEKDEKYFMPVFGKRFPVAFERGEGVYLVDTEGKRYLDMFGGIAVNALGYSDEGLKSAIKAQVDKLMHSSSCYYIESQVAAAEALCRATGFDRCFFSNSGAEANEGAMKLARKYFYNKGQHKYSFIAAANSFHGRTLATLNVTGQEKYRKPYAPLPEKAVFVPYGDAEVIEAAIDEATCGVILEPIMGEGGVVVPPEGYLAAVREICDRHGILLIFDEVQCGMGRTGSFLCCQRAGVKPDIVTLAKALGGGIPIGAFLAGEELAQAFSAGDHGSTFGGNHLATTAALYMINAVNTPAMLAHIAEVGAYLGEALGALAERYPRLITDVRGTGLIWAAQLAEEASPAELVKKLLKRGIVIGTAAGNTLRFLPPYTIEKEHVDAAISALAAVLAEEGDN